jgi:hypothetical protein
MLLITGSMAALIIGVWMLFRPESFLRANQFFSEWHSIRRATKPLMVPRHTERFVYRHHRPVGLLVLVGAVYVLYALVSEYDRHKIVAAFFGGAQPPPPTEWLVPGLALVLGACALFALIVSAFLLIRPSLLKGFEAWANKWISARRVTKSLDTMHTGPDRLLLRYPRLLAGLLILGSLYALIRLGAHVHWAVFL